MHASISCCRLCFLHFSIFCRLVKYSAKIICHHCSCVLHAICTNLCFRVQTFFSSLYTRGTGIQNSSTICRANMIQQFLSCENDYNASMCHWLKEREKRNLGNDRQHLPPSLCKELGNVPKLSPILCKQSGQLVHLELECASITIIVPPVL